MFFERLHVPYPVTYEVVPPRGCSINHLQPVIDVQDRLAGITITDARNPEKEYSGPDYLYKTAYYCACSKKRKNKRHSDEVTTSGYTILSQIHYGCTQSKEI